jgi:hypothetical protein
MSTWVLFLIILFGGGIVAFVMSPPTSVANWFLAKFEVHPELIEATTTVSIDDKQLEDEDKTQVIQLFNRAAFIKKYYGEVSRHSGTPMIIDTKQGNTDVRLLLYTYNDHVDVFKQYKNKVVAYQLVSRRLQEHSMSQISSLVHA